MPKTTDNSARAFQEIVRLLEESLQAGAPSVGLEYKDRELLVFHQYGVAALGVSRIPADLQRAVIAELVKRAGLSRKSRGKMPVTLLGKEYDAVVEKYDSFGEWAYVIAVKERKPKARG